MLLGHPLCELISPSVFIGLTTVGMLVAVASFWPSWLLSPPIVGTASHWYMGPGSGMAGYGGQSSQSWCWPAGVWGHIPEWPPNVAKVPTIWCHWLVCVASIQGFPF